MSFKNFKEYLTERSKYSHGLNDDDKGFANRDYKGDLSIGTTPQQQRLQPEEYYSGPNCQKNPGLMTADGKDRGKPFGDMASAGFTSANAAPKGTGKKPVDKTKKIGNKKGKMPTKKGMKVEQFLTKTKNMSDIQFTKHLLEDVKKVPTPVVRDLYGKEYVPEPAQTMKYVTHLMLTNENMMRRMVRELKRNDGFHLLVAEVLSHPETYEHLNEAARGEFGKMIEQKISMFFEGVSPPRTGGQSPGPASAGSPGGGAPQGGAFGGGGGNAPPGVSGGLMGGMANGGGDTVSGGAAAGGAGGLQGMGEDEMGGMGGDMDDDGGGDIEPEDGDEHHDDDDDGDEHHHDEDEDGDEDEDDDLADDEDEDDDDDEEGDEDDDHQEPNMGMGAPPPGGMGMMGGGGMGNMGM